LAAKVIGVTGSVGKTSTKDLIAATTSAGLRTTANERSFNNEQGLPITILDAPTDTEALVLEMGMRGFGEIAMLCEVARPDIGVVTVVGHSHTELLGGIDGVARAKRELVESLPSSGTAILNADDERVAAMATHTGAAVVTYGATGNVRVSNVELDRLARARFTIESPWGSGPVELAVSGAHMVGNAAAALAVAGVLGVDFDSAIAALGDASISGMRMEVATAPSGATVINDAYNANPTSMRAALDALAATDASRRVAILGLMAEIDNAESAHREIAEYAAARGIELLSVATDLYGIEPCEDPIATLGDVGEGDALLVKASRSAGLEAIAEELLSERESRSSP
jgi:UDP-N-acetylmuramoyl-tripeptide--D-alanyl-D-alanine ligase